MGASAGAADINFAGALHLTQGGNAINPATNFTFSSLTVTPGTEGGDAIENTQVLIPGVFSLSHVVGNTGFFNPNTSSITLGNATTGTLTADLSFVSIVGGTPQQFAINVNLSNVHTTPGTSALLASLGPNHNGSGTISFQFASGGATLNDLLRLGTHTGRLGNRPRIDTSVSGSVSVPEPASLALLASGMLFAGGWARRKFHSHSSRGAS